MTNKTSARKHATRAASDSHPAAPDKPEEQLYALSNMRSILNEHIKNVQSVMSLHAKQAIDFCDHHYEVSQRMQLENKELRTSIASLRASQQRKPSSCDSEKLFDKQHSHAIGLLVKRDMEARAAAAENYELRELLSASQAASEYSPGQNGLVDCNSSRCSEPNSPVSPAPTGTRPRRRSFSSVNTTSSAGSRRSCSSTEITKTWPLSSTEVTISRPLSGSSESRRRRAEDRVSSPSKKHFEPSSSSLVEDIMLPGQVYDNSSLVDSSSSSSEEDDLDHAKQVLEAGVTVKSNDMRAKMRQVLSGSKHNVTDFYHQTGYAQLIAKHSLFELSIMAVVSLNVIWIGIDASFNEQELLIKSDLGFIIMENLFCVIFTWELAVRFMAFEFKRHVFKDAWFVFDAVILFFMVVETWAMSAIILIADLGDVGSFSPGFLRLLRILKFCRMARLARLLRHVPEIMILLKGLAVAFRSISCTVCLLTMVIYIFAVAFKQLCKDTPTGEKYFPDLPAAMFTLFFNGCLYQNLPVLARETFSESAFLGLLLLVFVLVSPLTIMNMLIGVLVQVVDTVASCEQERSISLYIEEKVLKVVQQIDENGDGEIDESEFLTLLRNPELLLSLAEAGIDVLELIDAPGLVFQGKESLQVNDFVERMMLMRGGNAATFRDVMLLRKTLLHDLSAIANASNRPRPKQKK